MIDTLVHSASSHLVQSTLFAGAAALLTLAFRANRAQVRFWLWLSASLKFLIPFALLSIAGSHIRAWAPASSLEGIGAAAPTFLAAESSGFRATHWEESVPPRARPRSIEPRSIR